METQEAYLLTKKNYRNGLVLETKVCGVALSLDKAHNMSVANWFEYSQKVFCMNLAHKGFIEWLNPEIKMHSDRVEYRLDIINIYE